ncbi:MAG: helix-turn-helix domain-containing protein [Bacteroidales bacterium]|nr:helix-turn-helix domain-containing protein [Bacteroidales bacterium]
MFDSKKIFSKRLKSAREMKGLSMEGLSEKMDNIVSRQSIYKYEAAKMLPDSIVLIKLAEVLNVKVDYFFRPFSVALTDIEFRKRAKMSEKERKSIQQRVMDHVERYFEIEDILGIEENSAPGFVDKIVKTRRDAINIAQQLRQKWELGEDGITDVMNLLESKGIKIIEFNANDDFDGLSGTAGDDKIIVLNSNIKSTERKRFTAIHELGHLIMKFDESLDDKTRESLCHSFASEFLIPLKVFKSILGDISKSTLNMVAFAEIQHNFGISIDALIKKAADESMIAGNRQKNYHIRKNMNPSFKQYVEKSRINSEIPHRFISLVYEAYSKSLISVSKAAALLNVPVNDVLDKALFV